MDTTSLTSFGRARAVHVVTRAAFTELEGLTQKAAAERVGLSLSGMKSRVQRGRAQLRQRLLECCHIEFDRRGRVVEYEVQECAACGPGCGLADS